MNEKINHKTRYDEICKPKFEMIEKALKAFKNKLIEFEKLLKDYTVEQILKNGTEATMSKLDEAIQGHIQEHKEYIKEKKQGKQKFWITLSTGIITGLVITIATVFLMKML